MNLFVLLVALIAGFSGFMFGFDSCIIADIKDQVTSQLQLSDWQWAQIVSASLFGCLIGIPVSGTFSNKLSSRFLLKLIAADFILGTLLCAVTGNMGTLLLGRFIIGIGVGVGSYVAPLYIAEIAPPNRRGTLVLVNNLTITFGQAIAYLVGYFLHDFSLVGWRYLFFLSCTPALFLFLGMLFAPHSPRWLIKKYGFSNALGTLRKIRPIHYDVLAELSEIQAQSEQSWSSYAILLKKPVVYVLLVGIGLGVFQQGSGINAIMYYGPVIFASAGFFPIKNAILATFLIGIINFAFTVFTLFFIDKLGRRFLLLCGTLIAAISLVLVGYIFGHPLPGQKFWILGLLCFYVLGYCISVGSLFWVLISEIYPLQVRGLAMSIATLVQCGTNFIVSISFLTVYHAIGQMQTFLLFGLLCFIAYFFVYYFIPETKGVSLEKIEDNLFAGNKIRDIGHPLSQRLHIVHPS